MKNKYYSLAVVNREANIYIYGDIMAWEWLDSDVSSYTLAKEIEGLDVDVINVRINSYGGEVAEALAIYNTLKRQNATIKTYCDGFACSAASVVFMAGSERVMNISSLLMIHNPWTRAVGNAEDLRRAASDLDVMGDTVANTYKVGLSITDEKLSEMLKDDTWITPAQALEWGFATSIAADPASAKASASARKSVYAKIVLEKPISEPMLPPAPTPAPPKVNKTKKLIAALMGKERII